MAGQAGRQAAMLRAQEQQAQCLGLTARFSSKSVRIS